MVAGPPNDLERERMVRQLRQGDNATAIRQFDRFLELAPDDGRATIVSSLRAEAAGELPGT